MRFSSSTQTEWASQLKFLSQSIVNLEGDFSDELGGLTRQFRMSTLRFEGHVDSTMVRDVMSPIRLSQILLKYCLDACMFADRRVCWRHGCMHDCGLSPSVGHVAAACLRSLWVPSRECNLSVFLWVWGLSGDGSTTGQNAT
jgi:hypothetical protein